MSKGERRRKRKRVRLLKNFIFSQISYIAIFAIVVSITERKEMSSDPLNFAVSNVVFEVIRYFLVLVIYEHLLLPMTSYLMSHAMLGRLEY